MPVNLECKCTIRIAFNNEILLQDVTTDSETNIQSIQVTELMGVELIDTSDKGIFKIRTYTDEEQFTVSDEYTQWIFFVRPLKEGIHSLTLKIAVVELINGKERKRNIIVEKEVFIVSEISVSEEIGFEESNIILLFPTFQSTTKKESKTESVLMNKKLNLTKRIVLFLIAFMALMGVSCWASVESLHLLLPSLPTVLLWLIIVIFYVVSAIGTKLILDSFNRKQPVANKGWYLICGVTLLVVFWGCFIFPTATHTFFYRDSIRDVMITDLTKTKGKLQELANEGQAGKIIAQEKADFRNKIDANFSKFAAEINNPGKPGWADQAESVIVELETLLGEIQRLKLQCSRFQCRQDLINMMRRQVDDLLESKLKTTFDTRLTDINKGLDKSIVNQLITKIEAVEVKISINSANNDELTEAAVIILSQAYKVIEKYSDILISAFEEQYPARIKSAIEAKIAYGGISKIERMLSVIDVWRDFFASKYSGRGFVFWIIIVVMLGIGSFSLFNSVFAEKNIEA